MRKIVIAIFAFFLLLFAPTLAFAKDNTSAPVVLPASQTTSHDYFGVGPTVDVEGKVNGDAYLAGGTILVNGVVNGDVLAAGGNITIKGTVHNIRVAGGNVSIDGATVNGNVTVAGGTITIAGGSHIHGSVVGAGGQVLLNGPVDKTVTIGAGNLTVGNSIGSDVSVATGQLILTSGARLHGNLWFESAKSAQIDKGAVVTGKITHAYPPKQENKNTGATFAGFALFAAFAKLVLAIVIGMLLLALVPNYSKRAIAEIRDHFWLSLGIGILAWILTPFIILVLFITLIGIPLAFITIVALVIFSYIGKLYAALFIGWWAMERFGKKRASTFLAFLVGIIIFAIIGWIPVLGWLFSAFFSVIGFGAVLLLEKIFYTELRAKKIL